MHDLNLLRPLAQYSWNWKIIFKDWMPRGDVGVRIRPQHPLACRKRRLNGAACLPWAATRVAWGKDPGSWWLELTAVSSESNTPLWPLLVLDGRLNLARFNQSAGRAEPRDEWLSEVINSNVCHRPEYLNCQQYNYIYIHVYNQVYLIGPEGSG